MCNVLLMFCCLFVFDALPWPVYVRNLHLVRNDSCHNLSVLMCTSKKTPCISSFLLEILANSLIQKEVMQTGRWWESGPVTGRDSDRSLKQEDKECGKLKTRKTLPAYRLILLFNWGGCKLFFLVIHEYLFSIEVYLDNFIKHFINKLYWEVIPKPFYHFKILLQP